MRAPSSDAFAKASDAFAEKTKVPATVAAGT
jgi:hypothetical protein